MKIDLSRFRQTFFQEAADHVHTMETQLLALEASPTDSETLNSIFRAAHSIKGGSATFSFDDLTRFTHRLEELLDRMRLGQVDASPERIRILLQACDVLRGLLAAAEAGSAPPAEAAKLLEKVTVAQRSGAFVPDANHKLRAHDPKIKFRGRESYNIQFSPSPNTFREGTDPLLLLRDLSDLGDIERITPDLSHLPALTELQPDLCYLSWTLRLTTEKERSEIDDVFSFVQDGAQVIIKPVLGSDGKKFEESAQFANAPHPNAPARQPHHDSSIRVATSKVDHLINLVGELVIAQSMTMEIVNHFTIDRLSELQSALTEVDRNTRELQDRVMGVRMLPVGTVFARLPRIVHDVAANTGKSIRIELAGEETELDKGVLESMIDPLTHLVRNSADHGIESPDERQAAGKPEQGTIRLHARHEGGNFIIDVADDGRGLNTSRIREKAVERGLITGSEEMTREQIHLLIFQAGFSTAEKVSEVSGRGVGMDVVRKNVDALGGLITLQSREGQGTTVRIKLPLTLAIVEGQLVRVGKQTFVLPLVSIIESIRPTRAQVANIAGEGEIIVVRGEPVQLLRLHRLFGIPTDIVDPCGGLVAVVEHENRRYALLVDELLSQQQVVIKNLQANFRRVEGAMGATILGDGCVSLILDVAGLVERSRVTQVQGHALSIAGLETAGVLPQAAIS